MEHSNNPLIFEQLKEMVGEPVWSAKDEELFLVCKKDQEYLLYDQNGFCISLWDVFDYGLYSQPPACIDREAWKPCEKCNSCDNCVFCDDRYDELCDECSIGSEYKKFKPFKYCRYCGRPLTEEAWNMMEKRMGG